MASTQRISDLGFMAFGLLGTALLGSLWVWAMLGLFGVAR